MRFRITFLVLHVNTIISYISQLKQISYISQLKQIVNKISTPTGPPLMDAIPSVNYAIWSETKVQNRLDICIVPSPQNSVCPSVEVYNMEKDKISTGHRDHDRVKCILIVTLTLCVYFLRN